jgi:hypothetical protein
VRKYENARSFEINSDYRCHVVLDKRLLLGGTLNYAAKVSTYSNPGKTAPLVHMTATWKPKRVADTSTGMPPVLWPIENRWVRTRGYGGRAERYVELSAQFVRPRSSVKIGRQSAFTVTTHVQLNGLRRRFPVEVALR